MVFMSEFLAVLSALLLAGSLLWWKLKAIGVIW
jgi:hypothetical protein